MRKRARHRGEDSTDRPTRPPTQPTTFPSSLRVTLTLESHTVFGANPSNDLVVRFLSLPTPTLPFGLVVRFFFLFFFFRFIFVRVLQRPFGA